MLQAKNLPGRFAAPKLGSCPGGKISQYRSYEYNFRLRQLCASHSTTNPDGSRLVQTYWSNLFSKTIPISLRFPNRHETTECFSYSKNLLYKLSPDTEYSVG